MYMPKSFSGFESAEDCRQVAAFLIANGQMFFELGFRLISCVVSCLPDILTIVNANPISIAGAMCTLLLIQNNSLP